MASVPLKPNKETENYTRLTIFLINGGTRCLQDVVVREALRYFLSEQKDNVRSYVPRDLYQEQFDTLYPRRNGVVSPACLDRYLLIFVLKEVLGLRDTKVNLTEVEARQTLSTYLKTKGLDTILRIKENEVRQKNAKCHFMRKQQWDKLFPVEGTVNVDDLDITILYVILRNVFSLRPTSGRWDNEMPSASAVCVADDIIRLRICRGELCHRNNVAIDNESFQRLWREISKVLTRLGGIRFEHLANELRNNPVDSTLAAECDSVIAEWGEKEKTIMAELEEMKISHEELVNRIERSEFFFICLISVLKLYNMCIEFNLKL